MHAAIALLSACAIAAHLSARQWLTGAFWAQWPLFLAAAGAIPLLITVGLRLARRDLGSDFLAALSIVASALMGEWLVCAILVLMLSGGAALEGWIGRHAAGVLDALARRMPHKAHIRGTDGAFHDASLAQVRVGDVMVVYPHELCPVDGIVLEGQGRMDESYLTGEPFLLAKAPGSGVLSGAVNADSALTVRAEKLAVDSRYAQIMRVMEDSIQRRPRIRRLADELAAWYIPLVLVVAAGAWAAGGAATRFLAVLVAATPCPLIIAIPVAIMGSVSRAAKAGIIIRDPAVLEQIPKCRTAIFDKTGTLTYGKPALTEMLCAGGFAQSQVLRLAAALERYSRHPLAAAVLNAAAERGLDSPAAADVSEKPGEGLCGDVEGRRVLLTGRKSVAATTSLPPHAGGLECVAFIDGRFAALLRFRDAPQPQSLPFIRHLPKLHQITKVVLLSGDREEEVRYLAEAVGISEVKAQCRPEEKVEIVARHAALGPTLFVGDGINDAPALKRATVGVAIGGASDITSAAAGAVVLTPSIGKVDELIHIGRRMRRVALESAGAGMALSAVAIVAAALGSLSPIQGAVAQELIDLAAILNAARAAFGKPNTDF